MGNIKTSTYSSHSRSRILVVIAAIIALIVGVVVAPKANAAEVQPTVSNLDLTDFAGNPVDTVTKNGAYKLTFDFEIPEAEPGDTFTVQLPEGFKAPAATVALGDIATASRIGENLIEVTFTGAVADLENLKGGFSYLVRYDGNVEDGDFVDTETTIGNESQYIPEIPFGSEPGSNPMIINKWSGTNVSGVNDFEVVRLSGNYGYTEVKPAGGQTFAKWFVELNGWNTHDPQDAGELGDNIIVTDTLQSLGDFIPQLEQSPRPGVSRVLNQDELDGLLVGPYVKSRQDGAWGNSTVEVRVRDRNLKIATLHADVDDDAQFLTITENEDGSTTLELLLSEFLNAQYPNLTTDQKAILDDPKAQYSMAYVAVLPKQSASIINDASFTSSEVPGEFSDKGSYTYISVDGWGDGEFKAQPTTAIGVQKTWVGLAEGEEAPAVTFSLLANGEPAVDLDQNPVAPITFEPGTTAGSWDGLPTQLVKGEPITYTVEETDIEGFTVTYGPEYVVDLGAEVHEGTLTVTNTKDEEEVPPTTPSTEPTEPTTEPSEPTTEPSEPSTEPTEPSTEPTEPSTEPTEPAETSTPVVPTTEPSEPSEAPTTEPAAPTTEQENDPFGEDEPTSTPVVPGSSGSSENETLNRCVNNAVASPLLWLIPVGVVAGLGGKALEPYTQEFGAAFTKLTHELGMGGRFQSMFDEATRGLIGDFDPLREQRRAAEEFVAGLNIEVPGAVDLPQLPAVDAQEFGQVAGVVGVLALAGVLAAYWCVTPEGETLGAKLSS